MLPTVEVKAMAIILFALKLMFGLDDKREFSLSELVSSVVFQSKVDNL